MNLQQQLTERRRDAMWREVLQLKQERQRSRMSPQEPNTQRWAWIAGILIGLVALTAIGFLAGAGVAILTHAMN